MQKYLIKTVCMLVLWLVPFVTFAQNKVTISGTVKDAAGSAIPGVSVVQTGTTTGTITDFDGKFSLEVTDGSEVTFSYVGYEPQTQTVNGSASNLSITLNESAIGIEDVVVVGYGVQKKSDLTGSVASVSADDISGLATVDAGAALQGKAAGVQIINSSAAPGSGATIRVRGYSSNSDNIGPLLIVDGLKVDNIQYLDPSMIKSMEVLKDAASAAIYGAEAGNGVILITTKSGSKGTASINYSYKLTSQSLAKKPEIFTDGKDFLANYAAQIQKGQVKDGVAQARADLAAAKGGYKYDYDNPLSTDWFDETFENSIAQQHSLSFSGGNDKGNIFVSMNYVNNDGIVVGDKDTYKRLSFQMNSSYNLYKWLSIGTNNNIERWQTKSIAQQTAYGSVFAAALSLDPLTPVYWTDPSEFSNSVLETYATNPERILSDENGWFATTSLDDNDNANPLYIIARKNDYNKGVTLRGSMYADFKPVKGLVITSRLGYRLANSNYHNYQAPSKLGNASVTEYAIEAQANTSMYYQVENFANYNITLAEQHNIGVMVGNSFTKNTYDNVRAYAKGSDILPNYAPGFRYIDYVNKKSDTVRETGNTPGESTSISYFGRFSYSFADRYSLQFNFRADAYDSSKLSEDNRWGFFPSVSAGWTLSNESFIKDNINTDILSFAKIRASWGRNGNISVLYGYPYIEAVSAGSKGYYQYGTNGETQVGSAYKGIANPDLTWEISEQFDLGLDLRFLNSKLTVGLDYYSKITKDLLIDVPLQKEVYKTSVTMNSGEVSNKGIEIELGWKDKIGDLSYGISANCSTLKNEVTKLNSLLSRLTAYTGGYDGTNLKVEKTFEEGYSVWALRGFKYAGKDANGAPLVYTADGGTVEAGSASDADLTYIGDVIPNFTYGITLNAEYKGIDFTVFGTGVSGNNIFACYNRCDRPIRNGLTYFYDNKDGSMPNPAYYSYNFFSSDAAMFDGKYFKIKQIQLGYTLPKAITQKVLVNNLRVYVSLDDFITFTKYPGMDPETANRDAVKGAGFDFGTYPTSKKINFGVSVTF